MATEVTETQSREVAEAAREAGWKKPSFAKELFLGHFRLDLIYPQPTLDPAAVEKGEQYLAKMRDFLEKEVDPLQIERDAKIPDKVIDGLKKMGALGMKVPEEYGGLGLSTVYYNRIMALIGVYHSSLATLLSAHQSIGVAQPLIAFGSEEQKRKWLPLVSKDHISAFLLTEPDVGSDPARMQTQAVPTEDGTGYLLNGTKLWATNGTIADIVVVMAVVPPSEGHRGGITAFVLEYDSPGVKVLTRNQFMGLRGIENSLTKFENVFVPKENVIGREGLGLKIALTTLNTGRLAVPAICVGAGKWATKVAREFGTQRVQWGKPVGKHDAVAQKIAYIAASTYGLEAMIDVASRIADDKRNDVRIEAAIGKLYGSEVACRIADDLMQIVGGRGYETAESLKNRGEKPVPVEQMIRDMRINRIFEGSSQIMHLLIAREAVDQHLQIAGAVMLGNLNKPDKAKAALKAGGFYAKWFPGLMTGKGQAPRSFSEFGELAEQLRYVERSARKLARCTFYGMGRWQIKMQNKGHWLGRLVDIGGELFAISSAVVYTKTLAAENPERAEAAKELADVFCKQARLRCDRIFDDLWENTDDEGHKLARGVLDGKFQWLEADILDPSGDGPIVKPVG